MTNIDIIQITTSVLQIACCGYLLYRAYKLKKVQETIEHRITIEAANTAVEYINAFEKEIRQQDKVVDIKRGHHGRKKEKTH